MTTQDHAHQADRHNPVHWLQGISHLPCPVLLDSGFPDSPSGRYAIIAAEPLRLWRADSPDRLSMWERQADGTYLQVSTQTGPVLDLLGELTSAAPKTHIDNGAFNGGLIGLLSYELGAHAQGVMHAGTPDSLPVSSNWAWVGDYDRAVVLDHRTGECHGVGDIEHWQPAVPTPDIGAWQAESDVTLHTSLDRTDYLARMARIRDYLAAGDIYQVNLTRQFHTPWDTDPVATFTRLRQATPMPFSGYLDMGDSQVLSMSPERFIQVKQDGQVETRPIKGTRPRGHNPESDQALCEALANSEKDRAENLMIVDLLRNDLGRTAATGSVRVPELFAIERYANVFQLVSTVTATLAPEYRPLDALLQAFPGGSITGAPKRRALEVIAELEPHRRGPYCGTLFYQDVTGRLDSNILIRTLMLADEQLSIWSGGGIVWDSQPLEEFQETHDKIGNLAAALGLSLPES